MVQSKLIFYFYRYSAEVYVANRVEEKFLPSCITVGKIMNTPAFLGSMLMWRRRRHSSQITIPQSVSLVEFVDDIFNGDRCRPNSVVGIAVEFGILPITFLVVLRLVFLSCLFFKKENIKWMYELNSYCLGVTWYYKWFADYYKFAYSLT